MVFLFLAFCLDTSASFETALALKPIPEESDLYLQNVSDIAIARDGRIYVLDTGSVRVHIWKKDGTHQKSFGKKGQGPGEFILEGVSDSLAIHGDKLYVLDSGAGKVSVLDLEGNFLEAFNLTVGRGEVPLFVVVDPETLLIDNASWFADSPYRRLGTYDIKGTLKKQFNQVEDNTWRYTTENGQERVMVLGYAPTLVTAYDEENGVVLSGDNAHNVVKVHDIDGKLLRTMELELVRRDITREIQLAWKDQAWYKEQNYYQVEFPDKLPYYNKVASFDGGFVFYVRLYPDNKCHGIVTDKDGKTKRRFETTFGDSGGLFGTGGKLVTVRADDMGDLHIQLVSAEKT